MLDSFGIAFIICLICVAEFAFGWKAGESWERKMERK